MNLRLEHARDLDEPVIEGARPHVVIVGGGFGGLEAAKALADQDVRVTIIDSSNHHLFQPLLYQVATAGLSPAEIAIPIRAVLRRAKNVRTVMARVTSIDLDERTLEVADGDLFDFDFLVIAAGAVATYFGNDEWRKFAPSMKSIEDATEVRRDILLAFERADRIADPEERRRELTFAVIGGGPTGVELAGALVELAGKVLASDFRQISPDIPRIVLVEGSDRLLGGMSPESSANAKKALEDMGVEVRLGELAANIDERGVHLPSGLIEAETVIWAAGVRASPLADQLPVERDRGGRLKVQTDCSLPEHPRVFAIGDIARFETKTGPLPGVSPVAMQQGRYVAKKILADLRGEHTDPFEYDDRGMMATIGRKKAVAETMGMKLKGFVAWLAWLFVHLFYLVGFKNRVFVLISWISSYVFYQRGARLITHTDQEAEAEHRRRRFRRGAAPPRLARAPAKTAVRPSIAQPPPPSGDSAHEHNDRP